MSEKLKVILVGSLSHPTAEPLSGLRDLFEIVEVPDIAEAHKRFRGGGYAALLCVGPTLPEGLQPGQFQGVFFENVEAEFTSEISEQ